MASKLQATVRFTPFVKEMIDGFVKKNRVNSVSNAVEMILRTYFNGMQQAVDANIDVEDIQNDVRIKQVVSKFTESEFELLNKLASERVMSKGGYLAELFRANSTGSPRLCTQEIEALYQATSQIAAIGNNINQIARAVNSSPKEIDKAFAVDLKGVKSLIDELRSRIRALIKGNMRSWGVNQSKPVVKKNGDDIFVRLGKIKALLDEQYSEIDELQQSVAQ